MTRKAKIVLTIAVFVLVEAGTFYAYSFLFMLEGQPQRHGDPVLQRWARIYVSAMVAEFLAFAYSMSRILKSP